MRKVLRNADISDKKFRLLILKSMKNNIDELIYNSNLIEKEITNWFIKYREELINEYVVVNDTIKRNKYIKEYLLTIKRYEKIRRRQIQNSLNKYSVSEQKEKLEKKENQLIVLDSGRYSIDKNWRQSESMKKLLAYGPIAETSNCLKIKESIKNTVDEETKNIMDLFPERIINAIIMQKYKVFRNHINTLFSGKTRKALEDYPLIDVDVTLNKLQLGYVIFKSGSDNSIKAYIGYKKESNLYPYSRDRYEFSLSICDEETLNNINKEGINMLDVTKDEQFEAYITREKEQDSYLLCIRHGIRVVYDDIKYNDNILFLRTNDESYELEPVNNLIDDTSNIVIKNADTNINIRELTKKYDQLISLDNFKNEAEYKSNEYYKRKISIIDKLNEISLTYSKISFNIACNIENYCKANDSNLVIIYYRPDSTFNTNKITMNGKIIQYNMLKYLYEMGIECILVDQTNNRSNLYRKFKEADIYPERYKEINEYILNQLKDIEFTNDILNKLKKHNNTILKNDRLGIKRIYCNGNTTYYL